MDISMESLSNYHIYLSEILGEALSYDDWSKKQYEEMVKEMDGYEDKVRQQKSRMKKNPSEYENLNTYKWCTHCNNMLIWDIEMVNKKSRCKHCFNLIMTD
jgi:hypothetical protein